MSTEELARMELENSPHIFERGQRLLVRFVGEGPRMHEVDVAEVSPKGNLRLRFAEYNREEWFRGGHPLVEVEEVLPPRAARSDVA